MGESSFINTIDYNTFKQNMPGHYCGNIREQVYNNWIFNGEKFENISNIDDFILKTII